MPQDRFSRLEALAAGEAANAMGQRLDEMGCGDRFNGLQPEQWLEAMREGIAAYRRALVTNIKNEVPF